MDSVTRTQKSGQIRANLFMHNVSGQEWQLREYHLERSCTGIQCTAKVRLVPGRGAAFSSLFDDNDTSAVSRAFRDPQNPSGFLSQVVSLAANDVNRINFYGLDPQFFVGQSTTMPNQGTEPFQNDSDYLDVFDPNGGFAVSIQAELNRLGSPLTPTQIVRRAQTQTCAGCHELSTSDAQLQGGVNAPDNNLLGPTNSPLVWPDSLVFTQTSEEKLLPTDGSNSTCDDACIANPATCNCAWQISDALRNVFIPYRAATMSTFLQTLPAR